jgi:hypothetical protein
MNTIGVLPFFENWTSPATIKISHKELTEQNHGCQILVKYLHKTGVYWFLSITYVNIKRTKVISREHFNWYLHQYKPIPYYRKSV